MKTNESRQPTTTPAGPVLNHLIIRTGIPARSSSLHHVKCLNGKCGKGASIHSRRPATAIFSVELQYTRSQFRTRAPGQAPSLLGGHTDQVLRIDGNDPNQSAAPATRLHHH